MGILQFLLVISIIGIAIVKQVNKKLGETNESDSTSRMPSKKGKKQVNSNPTLPESWGQWFPAEEQSTRQQAAAILETATVSSMAEAAHPKNQAEKKAFSNKEDMSKLDSPPPQSNNQKKLGFYSKEDVRQAIIWSEILQRKY